MPRATHKAIMAQCAVGMHGEGIVVAREEALKPRSLTDARQYTCVECKAALILKRTKHERYNVAGFFSHKAVKGSVSGCAGGGPETQDHLMCKYYLKEFVGHYDFRIERCPNWRVCEESLGFRSKPSDIVVLEKSIRIDDRQYKYDTLIYRKGKPVVAVEVCHTHPCGSTKVEDTRKQGIALVEIHTNVLLPMVDKLRDAKTTGTSVELPNLKEVLQTCGPCEEPDSWFRLVVVVSEQDTAISAEHWHLWRERKRDEEQRQHRKLQHKAFRQAEEAEEACRHLRQQRAPYRPTNFKCVECDRWRIASDVHHVQDSKWSSGQYRDLHQWYINKGRRLPETARCCRACVVKCPKCGECYPLQGALRFGLCMDCNLEYKNCHEGE
jgi:hypothetical protein